MKRSDGEAFIDDITDFLSPEQRSGFWDIATNRRANKPPETDRTEPEQNPPGLALAP